MNMSSKSLNSGNYVEYTQYDSISKLKTAYANFLWGIGEGRNELKVH